MSGLEGGSAQFHGDLDRELARGIRALRDRIDRAPVPPSILDETLNIATWNIRQFGGRRPLNASILYIAEILSQFDLIVITGVDQTKKSRTTSWMSSGRDELNRTKPSVRKIGAGRF